MPDDDAGAPPCFTEDLLLDQLARAKRHEPQLVIDGDVYCRSCHRPLSLARLAGMPNAVRCVRCQTRRSE